ncbi:C6 zinc finger domain containing protein [Pleurostoma richardsiae]|uniref:C6 zinc finger domain containing protein n=1 Tax=Pleurostoma richardsiae TaxID=41990 RepID=A0AA38VXQ4_9PEZI|nr:C6 zinc finger domain containing protein [Pleurostoma richardsiae]
MPKTRITRSKTGCQACRRRKVRCDEKKPVCSACARLELSCSYQPGTGNRNAADTSRYRVRFVNSPWSGQRSPSISAASVTDKTSNAKPSKLPRGRRPARALAQESIENSAESSTEASNARGPGNLPDGYVLSHNSAEILTRDEGSSGHDAQAEPEDGEASIAAASQLITDDAHLNAGGLPIYFDLNMNFDGPGEDWLAFPQTPPADASIAGSAESIQASPVVIDSEDHGLIQHYLNVMTQYTKVRGPGDENIYTQIFSNMALFYAPLYNAIMAWTALHLGHTRPDTDLIEKAEQRYAHAVSLMHRDQYVAHHFELSLVTIWFALQFELLAARGIESFCRHLEFTADLVDAHRRHQKAGGEAVPLGRIGVRVLIWLGTYDARASWVGGTGRLLQNLELFCADYDFLDIAFPDAPSGSGPGSVDLKPFLRLTFELDTVEGRIVHFHRRDFAPPAAIWAAAQSDLLFIQERLEGNANVAPILASMFDSPRSLTGKITTASFNYLLLLAACYSLIISFHRMLPASAALGMPARLITAEAAAARIVRISSWVGRLRPPSPQNIWPRILFIAGIETTDLVYQEWVVKQFAEAELWGANFSKTRVLLEQVIKRQSREGVRLDYLDVMRQSTGLFII